MSSSVDLPTPFIASLLEGIYRYLPTTTENAKDILFSSSLLQVTYATLRTAPYALQAHEFGVNDFAHLISSRVAYLEAALLAVASTVHHFFMAVFYTAIVIITIGFSQNINRDCSRHWSHIYYGITACGIGLVGVAAPYYGYYANAGVLYYLWISLKADYRHDLNRRERQLVQQIQNVVKIHRTDIYNYFRASFSDGRYQQFFRPSLAYIEERLGLVQRMDDIFDLLIEAKQRFPNMGQP